MDSNDLKAFLAVVATSVIDQVSQNPIGSVTAVIGLIYVYQKMMTQKLARKKAELEFENKIKEIKERKESET